MFQCGPDTKLLKFNFERGSVYLPQGHVGCVGGCDQDFLDILGINLRVNRVTNNAAQAEQPRSLSRNAQSRSIHTSNDSGFSSNCDSNTLNDSDVTNCNCGEPARLFYY